MSEQEPLQQLPRELEVLSEFQCLEYLHSSRLGRIAFVDEDGVDVLPVNYASDGAIVVFRTAKGTKLDRSLSGRIAFEVDGWDSQTGIGWSVVLRGVAEEVTKGNDPFSEALRARKVVPLAPGEREHWIAVYPAQISGRRFRSSAAGS